MPQQYPQSPRSYILQNNNGKFTDITKQVCAPLEFPGMITAAIFTDFNNDKKPDLVICGEWTKVRFFKNENNKLVEVTDATGLTNMNGLWRSLQQADVDKDGDMDYIVGNMGLNNRFHIAPERPMMLYAKDMDKNGFTDLVPAYYIMDKNGSYTLFPALDRNQLAEEVPAVKKKYLLHADYAKVSMEQLKNDFGKDGWSELKCETTQSIWIENLGNGKFALHNLPLQAQFAPIYGMVCKDFNGDGNLDVLCVGNSYATEVQTGQYDAQGSVLLTGNGKGDFTASNKDINVIGDNKSLSQLVTAKGVSLFLIGSNSDSLHVFRLNVAPQKVVAINANDAYAILTTRNGIKQRQEFYYGSTYLSQSSRQLTITANIKSVDIYNNAGNKRTISF